MTHTLIKKTSAIALAALSILASFSFLTANASAFYNQPLPDVDCGTTLEEIQQANKWVADNNGDTFCALGPDNLED